MGPSFSTRMVLGVAIVVSGVGALDAALTEEWDLAVLFVSVLLLVAVVLVRTVVGRPLVPVRADLVRWLSRRAAVTGEPVSRLADRAIAAYRDGLVGEQDAPGGSR